MKPDEPLRVLMVCWGNICRSPTAEGILRSLADQRGIAVEVDSAGTSDQHRGSPPDRRAIAEAARRGVDISEQRSRQIRSSDFDDFDLILTADEMVDSRVRRQAPSAGRARITKMTGSLPDFERYPEVPDPYYGTPQDYRDVYDLLERAMNELLKSLRTDGLV
ncbi:MAG TPA: low molecular weight protein-tyrosine-phosphatase [Acidimicrobiia bacterium]|nr:low molecular weight protein-tyrosine-phosphatase [Acidimicrobiia bacterium]